MRRQRGNALIETAMFVPILVLLLMGMAVFGRVTYVYYSVEKALYNIARYIGTQTGANLCDASDPDVLYAKNWALTGSGDGGQPIIAGLSPDIVQVRVERQAAGSDFLGECDCSLTGCDTGAGGRPPDFLVVSVPDGFPMQITLPYLVTQTILFHPTVRVPFGGV